MGSAEQEVFQGAIDSVDELTNSFNGIISSVVNYDIANKELKAGLGTDFLKQQEEEAKNLERIEEARKKALEARKKRLQDILSLMQREENATKDLAKEKAEAANNEIELLNIAYGDERDKTRDAARREDMFNAESEALKGQLANRLISQEEYDLKVREMEEAKRVAERKAQVKAFKQQKAFNIVNAVMSGANAVLQALASVPPPASFVLAAVNGALAAAQIGIISSQQFRAARGGVVPGTRSKQDSVDAKLAPGEAVINSESASMFPQLLSAINMAGGGKSLAPEPVMQMTSAGGGNVSLDRDWET